MDLVTGSTGLAGFHVLHELVRQGNQVRAIIRKKSDGEKITERLIGLGIKDNYPEFHESDILDPSGIFEACEGIRNIYHCAGLVSFNRNDRDELIKVNSRGTANLVNQAILCNCNKFIHVSSVAALGVPKSASDVNETFHFENKAGVSFYALSKHLAEREIWRGIEEGLNAVIVSPSIILGSGNWKRSSMRIFDRAAHGMIFYSPGSGGFIDARDLASLMIILAESKIKSELFIVNGANISFHDLFNLICNELGVKAPKKRAPRWVAEIMWRMEKIIYTFTNRQPLLTRETVESAFKNKSYDSGKITEATKFKFTRIEETIKWIVESR
jgi:dihydroflavonol-4-reductase